MRARRLPTKRINHIFIEIAVVAFKQGRGRWAGGCIWGKKGPPRTPGGKWSFLIECSCSSCQFNCEWACICLPACLPSRSPLIICLFFVFETSTPIRECIFKWLLKALAWRLRSRNRLNLHWPRNWLSHAAAIKMSAQSAGNPTDKQTDGLAVVAFYFGGGYLLQDDQVSGFRVKLKINCAYFMPKQFAFIWRDKKPAHPTPCRKCQLALSACDRRWLHRGESGGCACKRGASRGENRVRGSLCWGWPDGHLKQVGNNKDNR